MVCRYRVGDRPPQPRRDIQSFWLNHCEDDWQKAFFMFQASANLLLIILFLSDCWPHLQHCQCNAVNASLISCISLSSSVIVPFLCAGVVVFYATLTLASWIKFATVPTAAIVMTVIFSLGFAYFFGIHLRWIRAITGPGVQQHGPSFKVIAFPDSWN